MINWQGNEVVSEILRYIFAFLQVTYIEKCENGTFVRYNIEEVYHMGRRYLLWDW